MAAKARERRANFIAREGRRLVTGRDGVRGGSENERTSTSAKRGRGHRVYAELYTGMASGRWTMGRVHGGEIRHRWGSEKDARARSGRFSSGRSSRRLSVI